MSDAWLDAFDGIDYSAGGGSLPDVIQPRLRGRLDTDTVRVPIRALQDIAERINGLSEALIVAQGGSASGLGEAELQAYLAEQASAERAAVKRGVLAEDAEGDWAALYDHSGKRVSSGHLSNMRHEVVHEGWSVVVADCEGLLDPDGDEVPATLDALNYLLKRQREASR